MSTPLTLTNARRPDGGRVLTVVGEIDMSNSRELAAAVEYLDSAGLSILLLHAERIEILATPLIAPVLTISGLPELTTVRGLEPAERRDAHEAG
jgi:hypothetical protein